VFPHTSSLTGLERRAVAGLTGIFAFRMLGLFLVLPVFALYARDLEGHTPFLVGLALGIYGLTQAVLQIPFGMASDRLGRKPVIAAGLLIFAAGSVVAAVADDIYAVVIGRALQGAGAIGAAVIALVADSTREESRSRAMAVIGISVGASFALSLVLGPALNNAIGVPGIFWLTAVLGVAGIGIVGFWVPTPAPIQTNAPAERVPANFLRVLRDPQLLRFDFGILVLHATLTALFVVVPVALLDYGAMPVDTHWKIYLPVILISAALLFPLLALSEEHARAGFAGLILIVVVSQITLFAGFGSLPGLAAGMLIFFVGFNVLEASLPALISKTAPAEAKGTAIGVYSTSQFLGAFFGGAVGGWLHGSFGIRSVFVFTTALLMIWFYVVLNGPAPLRYATRRLRISRRAAADAQALVRQLAAIPGVAQATVVAAEGAVYVEVNEREFDPKDLDRFTGLV
jgi:MFS family permease